MCQPHCQETTIDLITAHPIIQRHSSMSLFIFTSLFIREISNKFQSTSFTKEYKSHYGSSRYHELKSACNLILNKERTNVACVFTSKSIKPIQLRLDEGPAKKIISKCWMWLRSRANAWTQMEENWMKVKKVMLRTLSLYRNKNVNSIEMSTKSNWIRKISIFCVRTVFECDFPLPRHFYKQIRTPRSVWPQ